MQTRGSALRHYAYFELRPGADSASSRPWSLAECLAPTKEVIASQMPQIHLSGSVRKWADLFEAFRDAYVRQTKLNSMMSLSGSGRLVQLACFLKCA